MSQSSLSDSFEYLCYGSTIILYILTMTVRENEMNRALGHLCAHIG